MLDKNVISDEFNNNLDMSNSLIEFDHFENNEFNPIRYDISPCKCYIIGSDPLNSDAMN